MAHRSFGKATFFHVQDTSGAFKFTPNAMTLGAEA
jgi:hypothetical protein